MLLDVRNLKKYFPMTSGFLLRTVGNVKAVDDVSFSIAENEVLGLVGESGCGKSTVGRSILRLYEPTAGEISFDGQDVLSLSGPRLKAMRRNMQIIFQDPMSSLRTFFRTYKARSTPTSPGRIGSSFSTLRMPW